MNKDRIERIKNLNFVYIDMVWEYIYWMPLNRWQEIYMGELPF